MKDKEKLDKIIQILCLGNKAEFARSINSSPQTITNWLNRGISREGLLAIQKAYPEISPDWLLTGEGEMLADSDTERELATSQLQDEIPLIPASAFAGSVKGFAPDSITLQKCEWVKPPMQGAQYAIPITGDSMEPVFANGSIAYIRQINEAAFLPWGNAVILDTENGAFLKVIYPDEQDKEYIWAKSYNPNYPPLHIPTASVFRIFRVLGTSKIFTTM